MPTGYTGDIYNGEEVTGKEFILKCARAFGAVVHMRDEPLDKEIYEIKPSNYHLNCLETAKKKLSEYSNMKVEDVQKELDEEYEKTLARNMEWIQIKKNLRLRYEAILNEVQSWIPPTPEHTNLKNFAIEQLTSSIEADCDTSYYEKQPQKQSAEEYLKRMIEYYSKDIVYHQESYEAEVQKVNEKNQWIRQLKESLEGNND